MPKVIPTVGQAPARIIDSSQYSDFVTALEDQVTVILQDSVGQGTDPVNYIKTWWNVLLDFDINNDVPIIVVTARQSTQTSPGEMGTARELWKWYVDIYYIDIEQLDYDAGRSRRANIVQRMKNGLENETRLRNLSVKVNPQNPSNAFMEYVWNNDWTTVTFDSSGHEGYYSFVSELHLAVDTARN